MHLMQFACVALLSNGIFDVFFYYQEHKSSLVRIQREQAEAAAAKISQFVKEIESQLGWTTQLPWSAGSIEQRRFDALRLLRQVPAITELAQLDATGKERLRVSRLAMDVVASGADFSKDAKFTEAASRDHGRMARIAEAWDRSTAPGATSRSTISSASIRLQRLRLACRSGAQLIPILATRYGWARPGHACLWTDILNPL